MASGKTLSIERRRYYADRKGNQLPITVRHRPEGFKAHELFTWWVTDEQGYRLAVLHPPVFSKEEAVRVAAELCRRHGWRRIIEHRQVRLLE